MVGFLAPLREFNIYSVILRLFLAMICGGSIGLERGRKRRAAGFRTYMLVSVGAALTMLIGQYEFHMLNGQWAELSKSIGISTDVSRFGAQVINGIGFLGVGTIIVTRKQAVKGMTTAAGLWASACMGLAVGAGFYECVVLAFWIILLSIKFLPHLENHIIQNARNVNVYVEFNSLDDIGRIINCIKEREVQIYEVDIDHGQEDRLNNPSAVFTLRLKQKMSHTHLLAAIMELDCVCAIEEI